MNIFEYIKKDNGTYIDLNSELDALVLSLSVYFEFERFITDNDQFPLNLSFLKTRDINYKTRNKLKRNHNKLVEVMLKSEKFQNLEIIGFSSETDANTEKQFAVITYRINSNTIFVAFRGTDSTVLGWKEDLNMSFSKHVPSQESGRMYINHLVSDTIKHIYIGGHSKGGNIAVYAGAFCDVGIRKRIVRVYNFDGPGFHSDIAMSSEYTQMIPYVAKYIPTSSIVGQLMNANEGEIIIRSKQISFFQHDPYTWVIMKTEIRRGSKLSFSSKHVIAALQRWLETITEDERKYVIDEFYSGLRQLDIDSFSDVTTYLSTDNIRRALQIYNTVDPEFKKYVKLLAKQFILIILSNNDG